MTSVRDTSSTSKVTKAVGLASRWWSARRCAVRVCSVISASHSALAADLRDPVEVCVVDLPHRLYARHEARELLELRPLVVGGRHRHGDSTDSRMVPMPDGCPAIRVTNGSGADGLLQQLLGHLADRPPLRAGGAAQLVEGGPRVEPSQPP